METIQITFEQPEHLRLRDTVYFACGPDRVDKAEIASFRAVVFNTENGILALPKAARLTILASSAYFKDVEWNDVPLKYLTTDEDKATEWAVFYPVQCSKEDWFKAIGKRPTFKEIRKALGKKGLDSEVSLDECELQRCCAHISDIRDVFEICQEKKGLMGWHRKHLKWLIETAPHDMDNFIGSILSRVLKQLNLEFEWTKQ